ncbi:MAG: PAS domain-containing protein [Chthoniobacterales bacterium]
MTVSKRSIYTLPILIFVFGAVSSIGLLLWMIRLQEERITRDFARVSGDRSVAVMQRLQQDLGIPENIRQLYDSSDFVDENEFRNFVTPLLQKRSELDCVAWAPRVVGADGQVRHIANYLESQKDGTLGGGMTLEELPGMRDAIQAAVQTGSASWINLPSESQQPGTRADWLVVLPVKSHQSNSEHRKTEEGVLLARIDLHRLMFEAFDSLEKVGLDAEIYDGKVAESHVLAKWFSLTRTEPYDPQKERDAAHYAFTRTADLGSSEWTIYCRPAPHFMEHYQWWEQGFIFAGCLLLSVLVAMYLLRQRLAAHELRRQHDITSLLENVAVAANEAATDQELLAKSLQVICAYLDWPFGHVCVPDLADANVLVSSGVFSITDEERFQGMRHETEKMRFSKGMGLPGRVMESREVLFVEDLREFEGFLRKEAAEGSGLLSAFAFPVIVRDRVVAVVEFFHLDVSQPFPDWRQLLLSISRQMGLAMERRLAAEDLMEKTAVLENAADGIAYVDVSGVYMTVNKAYARMCGVAANELIGTNRRSHIYREDVDIFTAAYLEMIMDGRSEAEGRFLRPDGSIFYQELTMIRDLDRAGNLRGCYLFSRDITQREEHQKALRESEERFMAFMANNPASASIKDEESRLVYINPASLRNFGLTQNAIGKPPEELTNPEAAKIIRESDQKLLASNKPLMQVEVIPDRTGKIRHWLVYKFPMKGRDNQRLIGVLCLDMTDRMEAEAAMIEARDEALESARLKSQFLANMSHEIRTPMNGLIGMLGLLAKTELQANQSELLRTAMTASDSLLRLLNDILDFSKIDAGKMELDPVVFDPRQCLRHSVRILEANAHKKGLELTCEVAPEVPEHLLGDSGRLAQIVVNLVNNGIKFTHEGAVSVRLFLHERRGNEVLLHGVVRDTGIGVSESHRELIFQPFRQSDSSTARQYGGTGLGLAICSQLVDLMGGRIWIEAPAGGGSEFHFTVLMAESAEPAPAMLAGQPVASLARHSLRILLAEDNEINQQLAISLLQERGHHVILARNGFEAVELFEKSRFDLILMDVQMPGKDGYQATLDIRSHPRGKTIPIYAVTAHAMPEDRRRCLEVGMNDYLTKPIRVDQFAQLVEAKVERNETLAQQPTATRIIKTRRIAPPAVGCKQFDLGALRQMVNNNDALILQLASTFTRQAAEDRSQMQSALLDRNGTQLEHSAHRLKGSALSFSAAPLAAIAQTLETSGRNDDFQSASAVWEKFESAYTALVSELDALN